ncbi:MAG: hypothetical protein IPP47_28360 [Bryobacterales bacterium]|nr:hypothetical protein [Bryobacterales bacterium]
MKTLLTVLVIACLVAGVALAAGIDGKWYSERKMERDGNTMVIKTTFELKADGAKLTGKMVMAMGDMDPRDVEIKDGKIEGNKFSFTTTMSTPNGEFKTVYNGTLEGDAIKGTAAREGGQERPFEAKRQ